MSNNVFNATWNIIAKIFTEDGQTMTARQQKIFQSIVDAYHFALDERWLRNDEEFDALWTEWKVKANNDQLSKIGEIATLFFLAMFKFGE